MEGKKASAPNGKWCGHEPYRKKYWGGGEGRIERLLNRAVSSGMSDYRLKTFLEKVASFLPVYRFLERHHPKLVNPDYSGTIKYQRINNCAYVKPYGMNLRDKVILETGTGGSLADPITFYLAGAARTYTFDIKSHVQPRIVWGIIDHFKNNLKYLSEVVEVPLDEINKKWETLKQIRETGDFDKFLRATDIHLYESQVVPEEIKDSSVDIFFSNSVLQRISLQWLRKMVGDASRVLKQDGVFWHKIDCNDINAMPDKSISRYHYLKYSGWFWRLITSEIYNNQNRLRQSDFLRLFEEVGFKPIFVRSERPKDYREQLSKIRLNKRFQAYSLDDLSITNFIVYAGRETAIKDRETKYELHEFSD